MKINSLSIEKPSGRSSARKRLSEEEAAKRLSESVFNEIREVRKTSLLIRFLRQFTHFLALLLWVGAGLAFLSDALNPGRYGNPGLCHRRRYFYQCRFHVHPGIPCGKALEALKKLLPFYVVAVVREGKESQIPSREVVHR